MDLSLPRRRRNRSHRSSCLERRRGEGSHSSCSFSSTRHSQRCRRSTSFVSLPPIRPLLRSLTTFTSADYNYAHIPAPIANEICNEGTLLVVMVEDQAGLDCVEYVFSSCCLKICTLTSLYSTAKSPNSTESTSSSSVQTTLRQSWAYPETTTALSSPLRTRRSFRRHEETASTPALEGSTVGWTLSRSSLKRARDS